MVKYELRADYDGDGSVSSGEAEYGRRLADSRAKIVPNVDRDDRRLPDKAAPGSKPTLDWALTAKLAQDDEPARLRVKVVEPLAAGWSLVLRVTGHMSQFVRLSDRYGRDIPMTGLGDFPLATTEEEYLLDTFVFSASPLASSIEDVAEPRAVRLALVGTAPGQASQALDSGVFELPRLYVLDDLAPAERLYIAEAVDAENEPSVRDVEAVAGRLAVPVVRVPVEVNRGDLWMQDQFQLAWCRTPKGPRRFLIHLPRLRANAVLHGPSPNLAPFVAQHFPSKDLGLIEDFWKREFDVRHAAIDPARIAFEDSQLAYMVLGRAFRTRNLLLQTAANLIQRLGLADNSAEASELSSYLGGGKVGVVTALDEIPLIRGLCTALYTRAIGAAPSPATAAALTTERSGLPALVTSSLGSLRQTRPGFVMIPTDARTTIEVDGTEADRLFDRLEVAHDTLNYGGNLECSPPTPSHTLGKIVLGSTRGNGGTVDPDLLGFLSGQGAQPVVEVDTSWLQVAHVDEMLGFVPHASASAGFAIVRASSWLGVQLVRNALRLYRSDLSVNDDHQPGRTTVPQQRATTRGKHPITMMLRGKHWRHAHPVGAFDHHEPPLLFRDQSATLLALTSGTRPEELYVTGPIPTTAADPIGVRRYPAAMSAVEFDIVERMGNDAIEARFLLPLDAQLEGAFPGVPVLRVPVLYDEPSRFPTEDGFDYDFRRSVGAFLPNAANLQVLGNTVLIPRPFGPRMRPEHAGQIVRASLAQTWEEFKAPRMDARWFASRGLDVCPLWVRGEKYNRMGGNLNACDVLAELFADGFPKGTTRAEISGLIRQANPRSIDRDGSLKTGWQLVTIPEKTVDLFEACIVAVLEPTGVKVEFVDSWHYHVMNGEIHCGTNVLRGVRKLR